MFAWTRELKGIDKLVLIPFSDSFSSTWMKHWVSQSQKKIMAVTVDFTTGSNPTIRFTTSMKNLMFSFLHIHLVIGARL